MTGAPAFELVNLRVAGTVPSSSARERFRGEPIKLATDVAQGGARSVYFGPALGSHETPIIARSALDGTARRGPLIIQDYDGTTVVPPDCSAALDDIANIVIQVGGIR
jgi:N-methylhydantoinase A